MRKIFLFLLLTLILNFSTVFAAEVWSIPENYLQLTDTEKQNYIYEKIYSAFNHKNLDKFPKIKFEVPDGWNYEKFNLDGLPCEVLENPAAETDRVVLQFHGGGYILGLREIHRDFAIKQAVMARAKKIFMFDYRLAPKNIFPAALEDSLKIYKEILRQGIPPEKIIFIGDSAGGNLVLALSLELKEKNLPQPNCLILHSPYVTMENKLPSRKYNVENDLVLGNTISDIFYNEMRKVSYAKGLNLKNPKLSPLYADLKNLPPMLIQVGSYEIFLDECIELSKKAAACDVKSTLTIYPKMQHDFVMDFYELQETVDAFHEVQNFIDTNMN